MHIPTPKKIDEDKKIRKSLVILGILSSICCISFASFIFTIQARKNKVVTKLLIEHLELLLKKKPGSPILKFLLGNKLKITDNIELYFLDKVYLYLLLNSIAFVVIIFGLLIYEGKNVKDIGPKDKIIKSVKDGFAPNALAMGTAFFGTAAVIALAIFIPLIAMAPEKLSTLLCKGVDYIEHRNNALIEVFKDVIKHTFKEETLVVSLKQSVSHVIVVWAAISTAMLAAFIILGLVYCFYGRDSDVDLRLKVDEDLNIEKVGTECQTPNT